MDDFQFIIESPQHNQGHKKRPRLVTSCDNWYVAYSLFPANGTLMDDCPTPFVL